MHLIGEPLRRLSACEALRLGVAEAIEDEPQLERVRGTQVADGTPPRELVDVGRCRAGPRQRRQRPSQHDVGRELAEDLARGRAGKGRAIGGHRSAGDPQSESSEQQLHLADPGEGCGCEPEPVSYTHLTLPTILLV